MKLVSVLLLWSKVSVLFFSALVDYGFQLRLLPFPLFIVWKPNFFAISDVSRRIVISVYRYEHPNSGAQKRKCTFIYCNDLSQAMFLNLSKVCFQARTHTLLMMVMMTMMMINCFCGMVDCRKVFSFISSQDHCQRSSPSRISDTPRAGFEPAQNLSSGLVEWNCAVVITTKPLLQLHKRRVAGRNFIK